MKVKDSVDRPLTADASQYTLSEGRVLSPPSLTPGLVNDYLGTGSPVKYEIDCDFELSDEFKKFKEMKRT